MRMKRSMKKTGRTEMIKTMFVVILIGALILLTAGLRGAFGQLTFKGDIITDGPIEMYLETCSDTWETTSSTLIPFYDGVFGAENNFHIKNFECGMKYRLIIKTNENERKVIFIDLSEMNERFKLHATIDPKQPNVMVSWGKNGITYAHCVKD